MANERFSYTKGGLKTFTKKPECPKCFSKHVLRSATNDAPFKGNKGGGLAPSSRYIYMCCGCGYVIGYADNGVSPEDFLRALERPDLSAKYEGNISHV